MTKRTPSLTGVRLKDIDQTYRTFIPDLKKYWKRFLLAYLALFAAMVMNLLKLLAAQDRPGLHPAG